MKLQSHGELRERRSKASEVLSVEVEAPLLFDPTRDVPPENQQLWKRAVIREEDAGQFYKFAFLFPQAEFDPEVRQRILDKEFGTSAIWTLWALEGDERRLLERLPHLEEHVLDQFIKHSLRGQLGLLLLIKTAFPWLEAKASEMVDAVRLSTKARIKDFRKRQELAQHAFWVAMLRITFPESYDELGITPDEIAHMKREVEEALAEERERQEPLGTLEKAFGLAVVSAGEVVVSKRGVQLIPRRSSNISSVKPLPDRPQM